MSIIYVCTHLYPIWLFISPSSNDGIRVCLIRHLSIIVDFWFARPSNYTITTHARPLKLTVHLSGSRVTLSLCAHTRHNSRVQEMVWGHLKLTKKDIEKHLFQVQLFINGPLASFRP